MSIDARDWKPSDSSLLPGYELWRSGHLGLALGFFQHATASNACDPDAWRGLGSVQWTRGDHKDALTSFTQSLRLDSWSPVHWTNVGLTLGELALSEQAVQAFQVAIAIDHKYIPAYNEWANVLVHQGLFIHALGLYDQVIAADSEREVYHHNRAVCLCALGRQTEAIDGFLNALRLNPTYGWSLDELSIIHCAAKSNNQ